MTKRKTMTDIARECGVSQSTVSLVLSNNPRIGEATRAKILQAIERSGYRPNIHARGLVMDSSRIISVVLPAFEHVFAEAYFGELLSGIYAGASEAGYKVLLDLANLKFVRTQEYLNLLESRRVDGMIFLGSTEYDRYLSVFDHSPHKFLLINDYFPNLHIGHVMSDHRAAARLLADHLLGLGHRSIGIISGTNIRTATDFLDELEKHLAAAGLAPEHRPWADGRYSVEMGLEAARVLLTAHPDLTALICGNEAMALGALRHAQAKGLSVPGDLSITGMDNLKVSSLITPALTTVDQHLFDLGRLGARQLLAMIQGEPTPAREISPVNLRVRASTAPPRRPA